MTGNRNKIRTADLPVFSRSLSAAGSEKRSAGTRSHRMKFCVQKGLGELPNKQRKGAVAILVHRLPLSSSAHFPYDSPVLWYNKPIQEDLPNGQLQQPTKIRK